MLRACIIALLLDGDTQTVNLLARIVVEDRAVCMQSDHVLRMLDTVRVAERLSSDQQYGEQQTRETVAGHGWR